MPEIIGAALLAAGILWAGLAAAYGLYSREKTLASWLSFVESAGRDICFGLASLPELTAHMKNRRLAQFEKYISEEYSPFCGITFAEVWRRASDRLDLPERDREIIASVGGILGKYDADNQAKGLAYVREQLAVRLSSAAQARASHAKVYSALGIAGGMAVIIIFAI